MNAGHQRSEQLPDETEELVRFLHIEAKGHGDVQERRGSEVLPVEAP